MYSKKKLYSIYMAHRYFLYTNIPLELDTGMYCKGCIAERGREREKSGKGGVWLKNLSSKRQTQ